MILSGNIISGINIITHYILNEPRISLRAASRQVLGEQDVQTLREERLTRSLKKAQV